MSTDVVKVQYEDGEDSRKTLNGVLRYHNASGIVSWQPDEREPGVLRFSREEIEALAAEVMRRKAERAVIPLAREFAAQRAALVEEARSCGIELETSASVKVVASKDISASGHVVLEGGGARMAKPGEPFHGIASAAIRKGEVGPVFVQGAWPMPEEGAGDGAPAPRESAGVREERERCARIARAWDKPGGDINPEATPGEDIAQEIETASIPDTIEWVMSLHPPAPGAWRGQEPITTEQRAVLEAAAEWDRLPHWALEPGDGCSSLGQREAAWKEKKSVLAAKLSDAVRAFRGADARAVPLVAERVPVAEALVGVPARASGPIPYESATTDVVAETVRGVMARMEATPSVSRASVPPVPGCTACAAHVAEEGPFGEVRAGPCDRHFAEALARIHGEGV